MVDETASVRPPRVFAFPLAGLTPGDPRLIPGLALAPSQRRKLAKALQRAPHPRQVIEHLRQALQRQEPLARSIERLAHEPALLPQTPRTDDPSAPARDATGILLGRQAASVIYQPRTRVPAAHLAPQRPATFSDRRSASRQIERLLGRSAGHALALI